MKTPCIDCGCLLNFRVENDIIVDGDGVIAANIPGAVCQDCIELVLDKVADPPGLCCIKNLSSILAREIVLDFTFMLPPSQAVDFFISLFPEDDLVYAAGAQRIAK